MLYRARGHSDRSPLAGVVLFADWGLSAGQRSALSGDSAAGLGPAGFGLVLYDLAEFTPSLAAAHAVEGADAQGINLLSKQANLLGCWGRGLYEIGRDIQGETGPFADFVDGHPGMVAAEAHPACSIVKYAKLADQESRAEMLGGMIAGGDTEPTDKIQAFNKHSPAMTGDIEVGPRMVCYHVGNATTPRQA